MADTVCCTLFNKGSLSQDDFVHGTGTEAVYMTEKGRRTVIEAFEAKLHTRIRYDGFKGDYEQLVFEQACRYKKALSDGTGYEPFLYK